MVERRRLWKQSKPRRKAAALPRPLKVTACLLSWKRQQNLPLIIGSLRDHPFIDEILVWNNDTSVSLTIDEPKVRVINSDRNLICFGRYLRRPGQQFHRLCPGRRRNQFRRTATFSPLLR